MPGETADIRTFVAIELPDYALEALAHTQETLKARLGGSQRAVKWSRPEGVHITLQFLGDVAPSRVPSIEQTLAEACRGHDPFTLSVVGLGAFPSTHKPRVLWVGLGGDVEALRRLQRSVERELGQIGFKADKPFSPHITLGRMRQGVRREEIDAVAASLAAPIQNSDQVAEIPATRVSLMRSNLAPGGAVYTQLFAAELG